MKKKNGFIATSIMYSFFAVFTVVALITLASYSHYRVLIDNLNNSVLEELNTKISDKYVTVFNLINNGDFESNSSWSYNNSTRVKKDKDYGSAYSGSYSTRMNYNTSQLSQSFSINDKVNVDNTTHKIFVSFRVFRNGTIKGTNAITMSIAGNNYSLDSFSLRGNFSNWSIYSQILSVNVNNSNDWNIVFSISNNTNANYVFIDNVMIVDITSVYLSNNTTDADMKTYLNTYMDYFNGSFAIARY